MNPRSSSSRGGDNRLAPLVWREFLQAELVRTTESGALTLADRRVRSATTLRMLHRYLHGEKGKPVSPTIWTADRLLVTTASLTVDAYFDWARERELSPWRAGHPPVWHEQECDPYLDCPTWTDPTEAEVCQ